METLLHTPDLTETDLAALLVSDQPVGRINKSTTVAALIKEDRIVLSCDRAGRPVLSILSPAGV